MGRRTDTESRDSGSIVLGWLTKIVVVVAVAGVVLFDGVSVGVLRMSSMDDANTAAQAASESWRSTHNVQLAYNAAVAALPNPAEAVLTRGFSVAPDGTVHLLLRRSATTLVLFRFGPLKKYATVTVQGEAAPPTL